MAEAPKAPEGASYENSTLAEVAEFIRDGRTFAVCGHINPDGDCLGSVLAMTALLRSMGKECAPLLANTMPAPRKYAYLAGFDEFKRALHYKKTPDVFISVDTPVVERMGESKPVMNRARKNVSIDHHPGVGIGAMVTHCDTHAASASMIVWELAKELVGEPPVEVAEACFAGLLTDTGRFQFQNTDARCLAAAGEMVAAGTDPARAATEIFQNRPLPAIQLEGRVIERTRLTPGGLVSYSWIDNADYEELGARKEDTEGLVDVLRSVEGVEVAVLIRGRETDVRCSIRAKRDVDVAAIAEGFGGGGHRAAAGFNIECSLAEGIERVAEAMAEVERALLEGKPLPTFGDSE
ncbi:MAG: DHH family phosphoesterase [Coriobacteriales bacterium]|jgi:phosphoesterase RecJ-like protein